MKKVYICHPLRGAVNQNRKSAEKICLDIVAKGEVIPFSPLHAFYFYPVESDQELVFKYCLALLVACDEVWVYGDFRKSEGCMMEIEFALKNNIPVKHYIEGAGWISIRKIPA